MNKTKVVSAVGSSVLLVAAILAMSAHAGKPPIPPGQSKPEVITVSGAIEGSGTDAANMAITFSGLDKEVNGLYVANPDGVLGVYGTRSSSQTLRYYYCDNRIHKGSTEACAITDHDPYNYKCLVIKNGALEGRGDTEQIMFQEGCPWEIWRKAQEGDPPGGVLVASGSLEGPVIHKVTPLD